MHSFTWPSLASKYRESVRLRFESFNAKIDKPATEPAKILLHHPPKQSHIYGITVSKHFKSYTQTHTYTQTQKKTHAFIGVSFFVNFLNKHLRA